MEIRDTFAEFTSIGDEIVAVDPSNQPNEELENVYKLEKKLHSLSGQVENVEEKMQLPEGKVARSSIDKNLSERIVELQKALETKKQQLQTNSKLQTLTPAVDSLGENVRIKLDELKASLPETLDEQNLVLNDLEGKRQQLESLIETIPSGDEGERLRSSATSWLEQLNAQLKRLADVLGKKLAAIATFNANKDEIEGQLASLELPSGAIEDETSVPSCNDRIQKLEVTLKIIFKKIRQKLLV